MLGASFVPEWADPYWKNGLRRLGEGLGQFVYWMDAWEDLEEDMTTIPYNHYDYDISNTFIYLCSTLDEVSNWKQIGVKSIYTGNGETHESEIGWCTVVISDDMVYDGIAATKAQPVSVSYVDMAGRRVSGTQKGLLIRQERMADGSVKNVKVVRK